MKKSLKQAVLVGSLMAAAYACQPKVSQPSSGGGDAGSGSEQTPAMQSGQDDQQDMNSMTPTDDNSAPTDSMDQTAPDMGTPDQTAPGMDNGATGDQAVPETTAAPAVESPSVPAVPSTVAQPSVEKPAETAPAPVISDKADRSAPSSVSSSTAETAPSSVSKATESDSAPSISSQSLEAAK